MTSAAYGQRVLVATCILLLNRELERDRLDDYKDRDLPREYPRTLRDMSINSYHRYLKVPQVDA